MNEHPILYSTAMVEAKLAGRKTMTRRIIKESFNGCLTCGGPHPCPNDPVVYYPGEIIEDPFEDGKTMQIDYPEVRAVFHCSTLDSVAKCPFGKVGDILWAKEMHYDYGHWQLNGHTKTGRNKWFFTSLIKSDEVRFCENPPDDVKPYSYRYIGWYKRNSLFMPYRYARIWEKITSIRVERLQAITDYDAVKEGVHVELFDDGTETNVFKMYQNYLIDGKYERSSVDSFKSLWQSINGMDSWDQDPWVWVIETTILSTDGRPYKL